MSKKNKLYVVMMYKYGDRMMPAYNLGVYSTKTKAFNAMKAEEEMRGGEKYKGEITEQDINSETGKYIHKVKFASYWTREKSHKRYTKETP